MASRKKEPPSKISFEFVESKFHRNIHVDGAWGGLTHRGSIFMAVYSETPAIPKKVTHYIEGLRLGAETKREVGSSDVIRELEATLIMNLNTARIIRDWLTDKIDATQKAIISSTELQTKGVEGGDTAKN
ncbi:MAG: hypothetical protein IH860_00095 [Chloroflexi bacterium]|nr:hypothetical protein [Chloroflexota bacterium]